MNLDQFKELLGVFAFGLINTFKKKDPFVVVGAMRTNGKDFVNNIISEEIDQDGSITINFNKK